MCLTHVLTDWLTLSELAFEWADSYDAKVSRGSLASIGILGANLLSR